MELLPRPPRIFFAYTMDCERIAAESILNNGTPSWEVSEKAILGMADVLRKKEAVGAGAFYSTPATAAKHRDLFLSLEADGFDLGCQFHCDSFREGQYTKCLGEYGEDEQREILALAKEDWEQALELPLTTFRCGFASANDYTFGLLSDLGVRQSSASMPGRYLPVVAARWTGAHRYPHHTSRKCRLICGDLDLYEVPVTTHPYRWLDDQHTNTHDLRPDRELPQDVYRDLLDACLDEMLKADPPLKTLVALTHNTIDYLDPDNPKRALMEFQIDYARYAVEAKGYEFVPASLEVIHAEADRIGAY